MSRRGATAGRASRSTGELLVAGFEGTWPSPEIRELIFEHRLGGVILYGKNCEDALQVLEMTGHLQRLAAEAGHERPLFVLIDQEQGRVARIREGVTLFPSMGEIARLGDPGLVERVAAAVSRELLAVGVNWNLAPVADVITAEGCPVGDRSFGSDPSLVGSMVAAWVRGSESAGLISCLKHFPGHGGTSADSHFSSPVVTRSSEEIRAVDLEPFRAGIAAGAPAVMTTHITFPAVDPSSPATFSAAVLGGLLRRELAFRGVILSDDLEMSGAAERHSLPEGALAALRAGVDIVLVSGMLLPERDLPGLAEEIAGAAARGDIPSGAVESSLARTAGLKKRYLRGRPFHGGLAVDKTLRCPAHLSLLDEVGERLSGGGKGADA